MDRIGKFKPELQEDNDFAILPETVVQIEHTFPDKRSFSQIVHWSWVAYIWENITGNMWPLTGLIQVAYHQTDT